MLAIEVEYLIGRVVAARHDDRKSVEWPPHPARLFSALVAAFHESDLADEGHPLHQASETALRWLEQKPQRAPQLYAEPPEAGIWVRDVPDVFVPANDHESDIEPASETTGRRQKSKDYWSARTRKNLEVADCIATCTRLLGALRGSEGDRDTPSSIDSAQQILGRKGLGLKTDIKKKLDKAMGELTKSPTRDGADSLLQILLTELLSSRKAIFAEVLHLLPSHRNRSERWFPAFTPIDPVVRFIWPEAEVPEDLRPGLAALAERVTYLGHSMSPVRVAIADSSPLATLRPDSSGDIGLRTVGEGRLDHLREIHALRVVNSAIQPRRGLDTFYAVVGASSKPRHQTLYRRWLAFCKVAGPSLPAEMAVGLCERVRRVVLDRFPDPLPEWVSGHAQDGSASLKPHLMVIPLSDVGHRHADGHLLGFTLLAPADVTDEEWASLEDALYGFDTLLLGAAGKWKVAPVTGAMRTIAGLRPSTWQRESRIWGSATPVVFGHFPDRSRKKIIVSSGMVREIRVLEVDEQRRLNLLAEMCEQVGLRVSPVEVRIGPVSPHVGVPKAEDFSRSKLAQGRFVTHLWVRFEEPVRGPLVLGRGRFGGLGLMRPLD